MAVVGITAAGITFTTIRIYIARTSPFAGSTSGINEIGIFPTGIRIAGFIMRGSTGFIIAYALGGIGEFTRRSVDNIRICIGFAEALRTALKRISTKGSSQFEIARAIGAVVNKFGSITFAVSDAVFINNGIRIVAAGLSGRNFTGRKQRIACTVFKF